jgi:hypothetical protein
MQSEMTFVCLSLVMGRVYFITAVDLQHVTQWKSRFRITEFHSYDTF